jgi:hypothetical protein
MQMAMFRLIYEIDIEADTAEDAAMEAYKILTDPESIPPVFDVIQWDFKEDGEARATEYDIGAKENTVTIDCETLLERENKAG